MHNIDIVTSDVLPWQCQARSPELCKNVTFIDVDYPNLIRKKLKIILATPQLRKLLGENHTVDENSPIILQSNTYYQVGCDLQDLDNLRSYLDEIVDLDHSQILFLAEVSITYMDTRAADDLIRWARSIGEGTPVACGMHYFHPALLTFNS